MSLKQLSKEELRQTSFIEIAHELLVEKKKAMSFEEVLKEIKSLLGISESEVRKRLVQFYTDLNIDGRFLALGDNRWGLREWYPVDQIEEETVPTMKSSSKKKKKAKKKDEIDLDDFDDLDDEDLDYDDLDDTEDDDLTDDDDDDDDDDVVAVDDTSGDLDDLDDDDDEEVLEIDGLEIEDDEAEEDDDEDEEDEKL